MAVGPNPSPIRSDEEPENDELATIRKEIAEARQEIAKGTAKIEEALKHVG